MNSVFKLCKSSPCSVSVLGLEEENEEYLFDSDITISTRAYTYEQSVTLNAIYTVSSSGEETLIQNEVNVHKDKIIDESIFEMPTDGIYKIIHMIIPTDEWLDYVIKRDPGALDVYHSIYVYSLEMSAFIKYNPEDSTYSPVNIQELLEVNACPPQDTFEKTTTLIKDDKTTFNICHISECYYLLCKNLFDALTAKCAYNTNNNKLDIYNRDLIWMSINIIKYLLEKGQYFEAQRILERVTFCGTICKQVLSNNKNISNCGCGT